MKSPVSHRAKRLLLTPLLALALGIALCLFGAPATAQWSAVAPGLLGAQNFGMGSIIHKGGLTWAGSHDVWMSPDSGITWVNRTLGGLANDYIDDINFFDRQTGIVCTHMGSVFRTDDGGLTWREIRRTSAAYSGTFLSNTNTIVIGTGGAVEVSQDGGSTWTQVAIGTFVTCVRPLIGGAALALGGDLPSGRAIYKTTDYGVTWQRQPGNIDFDSWSFDVNPCEPSRIYAVNEECTTPNDGKPAIYASADEGTSWTVRDIQTVNPYFSGSVAIASPAVFAQTFQGGILRSVDQGVTWAFVGGPSATFDSRLVCPISANIVLAADNSGTIWRTINSGGDSLSNVKPLGGLDISPQELFTTDTLLNCDSPVIRSLTFTLELCSYPKIDTQYISGPDSLDYTIVKGIVDSLSAIETVDISFHPRSSGPQHGEYILILEDGTRISVPLAGTGRGIVFVEPLTASASVDTIGGDATLPITLKGFPHEENVDLVVNYDPKLIYLGAFALDGAPLDIASEQWSGRSKLHLDATQLRLDTASGELRFRVFPDGDTCFAVALDSLTILNPKAPCTYSVGAGSPQSICPPRGCGVMTITRFLRYHTPPELTVFPNPGRGTFILHSTFELGAAELRVCDDLGKTEVKQQILLHRGDNLLQIPTLIQGWHVLRIQSDAVDATCTVLVQE